MPDKDTDHTEFPTCPYCGFEDEDTCEISLDDTDHDCPSCGAVYFLTPNIRVTYTSTPLPPPPKESSDGK